ncbi:lamin tail domain-containing protein [Oceanicoccus sagamiensis]|uniref:LTD domain-containing protein n=1 Tax=Oceanicoccus sagamiensis TaxID=716816 RepID=A0A1X9NK07_9GAMM|nr:lamin tail domain-containing protein [Oceanicoccus sagamiensis]ARN76165.1 hypothetical protein BST96_19910 [Oceanicoccus sagamiensis]
MQLLVSSRCSRRILTISSIALFSQLSLAAIFPGDLLITEMMANPDAVSDSHGEWFEIINTTPNPIDLNGLLLKDKGSKQHTINRTMPLWINPSEYFVLGRNADSSVNGGYSSDYTYSDFTLGNSSDAIILEFNGAVIDSLVYSSSIFGTAGNSIELISGGYALTAANLTYGAGDIGTPGSAGSYSPVTEVPIPAAGWLFVTALSGVVIARKRSQTKSA